METFSGNKLSIIDPVCGLEILPTKANPIEFELTKHLRDLPIWG